ncbi:MAG: biotin/lipoate A/B protein ligase family protein [Candidatus Odinarchaeota archaeon]
MEKWRFIPLQIRNGYWNMALDEAILNSVINKKSHYTIRFYKWKPSTISIGLNQSFSAEVNLNVAKENGFNIVRRITGGGAVFHDEFGEITYSIVCSLDFLKKLNAKKVIEQFEIIETGIVNGLTCYGLKPEKGIIHCPAIFLNGKKFSGNAQVRKKGCLLQHGTILLEINPELMYSVLKAPYNISKSKMVKSVYSKCVGIRDQLQNYNEKDLLYSLKRGFESTLGIKLEEGKFIEYELNLARKLMMEKYSKENWLKKYE